MELRPPAAPAVPDFSYPAEQPSMPCFYPPSDTEREESAQPPAVEPETPPLYLDENVQFTVYRPKIIAAQKWYTLLAFAHLSERPADAPEDEPDPVEQVEAEAEQILGEQVANYDDLTEDSTQAVPRKGEITFVPFIEGVEFNPPSRSFLWQESVHRQDFRLRAPARLEGQTARGRLSVFLGTILLADVGLSIRIDSASAPHFKMITREPPARPYRKIFTSYSYKDREIVDQIENYAQLSGDRYLRDVTELRSGQDWQKWMKDTIREADIFQLFWSTNSMRSKYVRIEWEYALSLDRQHFVRPTYWERPLPESPVENLPPEKLRQLHFQYIRPLSGANFSGGHPAEKERSSTVEVGPVGEVSETIITPSRPAISRPPQPQQETTLRIRTNPAYSRVYINNVSVGKSDGSGEMIVQEIQSGAHRVRVVHDGYAEWERQIECQGGECRIEAELQSLQQQQSAASMEAQRLRAQAAAIEEKARQEELERREAERREQERREMEERDRIAREEIAREEEARRVVEEERRRAEAEAQKLIEGERPYAEAEALRRRAAERQRLEKERLEREERERASAAERERLSWELKEREERMSVPSIAPDMDAPGHLTENREAGYTVVHSPPQSTTPGFYPTTPPPYAAAERAKSSMPMMLILAVVGLVLIFVLLVVALFIARMLNIL